MNDPEICICAAIRTAEGEVVRGHRHDDAMMTAHRMRLTPSSLAEAQGFVTSRNRYVDREEGARLQNAAGIVSVWTGKPVTTMLFSEDLYLKGVPAQVAAPREWGKCRQCARHVDIERHNGRAVCATCKSYSVWDITSTPTLEFPNRPLMPLKPAVFSEDAVVVTCPRCGTDQEDHDGFGVLHCVACGFCTHASVTDSMCQLCGLRMES